MVTTESSSSLRQVLVKHFESHQHQSVEKLSITVAARVAQIQQQLKEFALNDAVNGLSLNGAKSDSNTSETSIMGKLLLHFVDCAIATEMNSDSQDSVDSILELAAAVAVGIWENKSTPNAAATAVLERAIQFSSALLERVRSLACRLIGYILESLESYKIENTNSSTPTIQLWEIAASALLPRLLDKSQAVRKAAIEASGNAFTENTDLSDDSFAETLQEALLYSVQHDPSVSNRVAAVQSLLVSPDTIPYIIARVRDVKSKVRVAALSILLEKVKFTDLSADQCAELIRSGLTDRYVCCRLSYRTFSLLFATFTLDLTRFKSLCHRLCFFSFAGALLRKRPRRN